MQDAWRAYLELALGVTEASRKKAEKVAKKLVGKGGAKAAQLQALVDDLVSTSQSNRDGLAKLVRYEVDRTLSAVGVATTEEVAELRSRVRELERQLREALARSAEAEAVAAAAVAEPKAEVKTAPAEAPARKSVAKKTVAKKTVKKAAPKKTVPAQASVSEAAEKA